MSTRAHVRLFEHCLCAHVLCFMVWLRGTKSANKRETENQIRHNSLLRPKSHAQTHYTVTRRIDTFQSRHTSGRQRVFARFPRLWQCVILAIPHFPCSRTHASAVKYAECEQTRVEYTAIALYLLFLGGFSNPFCTSKCGHALVSLRIG